jgi:hypothetical protein
MYMQNRYCYTGAKTGWLHVKFRESFSKQMLAIYHEDLVAQGYT